MSIHTILSQEIEKLMNKMGTDHRIFMLADGKTRNDLENTIRSFATRIVEEVGSEIISVELPKNASWASAVDELRKAQRTKLQKMKG